VTANCGRSLSISSDWPTASVFWIKEDTEEGDKKLPWKVDYA
jgi:hypothetical protein